MSARVKIVYEKVSIFTVARDKKTVFVAMFMHQLFKSIVQELNKLAASQPIKFNSVSLMEQFLSGKLIKMLKQKFLVF